MNLGFTLQQAQGLLGQGRAREAWALLAPHQAALWNNAGAMRLSAVAADGAGNKTGAVAALERVLALEPVSAPLVEVLANLLRDVGRTQDALAQFDRLVALAPTRFEAHLNRAITALDFGEHEQALKAAELGLKQFPNQPRLLSVKGAALKNLGRAEEAIPVLEAALRQEPGRALTWHNFAVALRSASRFDEACGAFARSEQLGLTGAQFQSNWAASALEAGRIEEAEQRYEQALIVDPDHEEAARALVRLRIEYRDEEQPFRHYEERARRSGDAGAWRRWIDALIAHDRLEDAAPVAEEAAAAFPDEAGFTASLAYSAGLTGHAAEWLQRVREGFALPVPLYDQVIPPLALRAGEPELAASVLERVVAEHPDDQNAWSLLGIAWRLLNDPREQWLCDYERLVMVTEVVPVDGHASAAEYAAEMAKVLDGLHVTKRAPGDQSLRQGTQTSGALFERPDPAIRGFRDAVIAAVNRATAALPSDPAHPLLRRRGGDVKAVGSWSVRLSPGGHHVTHIHTNGWLSSAFYARLPPVHAEAGPQDGWIQFGVPPASFDLYLTPRRVVEPKPGRLVLFPSYMWHGTIPFRHGDRLTAAFDFQPR